MKTILLMMMMMIVARKADAQYDVGKQQRRKKKIQAWKPQCAMLTKDNLCHILRAV